MYSGTHKTGQTGQTGQIYAGYQVINIQILKVMRYSEKGTSSIQVIRICVLHAIMYSG